MQQFVLFIVRRTGNPVGYINTDRVASRHDARTGRGANRAGGIAVIKLHPRLRQIIDIWGFMKSGTIGSQIHHPHIIDQEEDEIRLLLGNERNEKRAEIKLKICSSKS